MLARQNLAREQKKIINQGEVLYGRVSFCFSLGKEKKTFSEQMGTLDCERALAACFAPFSVFPGLVSTFCMRASGTMVLIIPDSFHIPWQPDLPLTALCGIADQAADAAGRVSLIPRHRSKGKQAAFFNSRALSSCLFHLCLKLTDI